MDFTLYIWIWENIKNVQKYTHAKPLYSTSFKFCRLQWYNSIFTTNYILYVHIWSVCWLAFSSVTNYTIGKYVICKVVNRHLHEMNPINQRHLRLHVTLTNEYKTIQFKYSNRQSYHSYGSFSKHICIYIRVYYNESIEIWARNFHFNVLTWLSRDSREIQEELHTYNSFESVTRFCEYFALVADYNGNINQIAQTEFWNRN